MEGEEAAPLVDPAVVLTLRGRVEAASGADIARALPSSLYEKWLLFATAPAPELLNIPGKGVFLAKSDTQASSYAFYFEPIFVQEAAGAQFKLKCRAGGCGTVCLRLLGSYKKEEASQLLAGWKNRDHVKALAGEGEDQGDDHDGGDQDECAPLIDVLRSEMMQYRAFLDTQAKLFMQHRDEWGKAFPAPFGLPLGPKVDARYEFWPQRKKEWPLLYFCATQLLAGSKASSCSNERTHSVAGRICSKLRGSLQPSSIEKLTLAYHYIRREVKETLAKWGKEAEAKLD